MVLCGVGPGSVSGPNCGKLFSMIRATTFDGKRVAVFGLGGSGIVAAQSLVAGGADVACWDDGEAGRRRAGDEGLAVVDLNEADWSKFDALVLAPGVPLTHPEPHWTVRLANDHGVEVIGDIEIYAREREKICPDAPFIAITGTNGKSTTTALIAHLLGHLGFDVQMGGNIGRAILTLEPPAPDRMHVVEMSSYQIDLTPTLKPSVGVLLNVTPDHIDRHGTLEHYAEVKARLLADARCAVVGIDDQITGAVAAALSDTGRLYAFTCGKGAGLVPKLYAIGQSLFVHEQSGSYATSEEVAKLDDIGSLRGQHNVQNALAALAVLRSLQDLADTGSVAVSAAGDGGRRLWAPQRIAQGLATFPGLPHRMEEVGRIGGVLFINDSKATNAEAAAKALSSFEGGIHWIAGGRAKAGGIESLQPMFSRIDKAYLIGEAQDDFARTLDRHVSYERCETLERAVGLAAAGASSSAAAQPVVLFSPACASFDQFAHFEVRGDTFRDLVGSLPVKPNGEAEQ